VTRVVVLGAAGTLGRRIVGLLERELPELRAVGAGRRPERCATGESRRLDLDDPTTFPAALEGAAALVHAAGPFDHDVRPLVAACRAAGADYLDLAEDPAFLARVAEVAGAGGPSPSRLVSGCSTVPGMVALLAGALEAAGEAVRVEAYLSLGSRNPVSPGLLYGLLRPLGSPAPEGGRWFESLAGFRFADGTTRRFGSYPIACEAVRVGGRELPVRFFAGFDRALLGQALRAVSRVVPSLSREALRRACGVLLPLANAARLAGTAEGRLALVARDASGAELARLEVRAEAEGLDVPAAPVVWALRRLALGPALPGGLWPLERLVEPDRALAWLRSHGCRITGGGAARAAAA
jgi:hypothetical protein